MSASMLVAVESVMRDHPRLGSRTPLIFRRMRSGSDLPSRDKRKKACCYPVTEGSDERFELCSNPPTSYRHDELKKTKVK